MTFLIDENLSWRLKQLLEPAYGGCRHVSDCGLLTACDDQIHARALVESLALLSKDRDFKALVDQTGPPPKLVFVRLGNASTRAIAEALFQRSPEITSFLSSPEGAVFEIDSAV